MQFIEKYYFNKELSYRKFAPNYNKEGAWRTKQCVNPATHKYTREEILQSYSGQTLSVSLTEELIPLFSVNCLPPLLDINIPFYHPILDDPNSRKPIPWEKRVEQVPEWYNEDPEPSNNSNDTKSVEKAIENLDLEEEIFSKIDSEVEKKLKNELIEDETMPEWDDPEEEAPAVIVEDPKPGVKPFLICDSVTLNYHLTAGNPFAKIVEEFAKIGEDKNVYCVPMSKPFEKIWYYKDLENKTQGPFSSVEMFNWAARGCFPQDLKISQGDNNPFMPMNRYNSKIPPKSPIKVPATAKTIDEIEKLQTPIWGRNVHETPAATKVTDITATNDLKSILGLQCNNLVKESKPEQRYNRGQAKPW